MKRFIAFAAIAVGIIVLFILVRKWLRRRWDASKAFLGGFGGGGGGKQQGFKPDNAKVPSKSVAIYNTKEKARPLFEYTGKDFIETNIIVLPGEYIGFFDAEAENAVAYFKDNRSGTLWTMLRIMRHARPYGPYYVPAKGVTWNKQEAPPVKAKKGSVGFNPAVVAERIYNKLLYSFVPNAVYEVVELIDRLSDSELKQVLAAYRAKYKQRLYDRLYELTYETNPPTLNYETANRLLRRINSLS